MLAGSRFTNKCDPVRLFQTASRYPTAFEMSRGQEDTGTGTGSAGATSSVARSM